MKIAIISDSHDNVANLEKLIDYLNKNKISVLIHAGDLCAPSVLTKILAPGFKETIHLILGNVGDPILLKKVAGRIENVEYYERGWGETEIEGRKIGFAHFEEETEKMAKEDKYDLLIFGHTHRPAIFKIENTKAVNPGTVGGLFEKPTFAVYDTKRSEVKILELDKI